MYESGKRTPPLGKAIKIAQFFDVPVEEITFSNFNCNLEKLNNFENNRKKISKTVSTTKGYAGQISMQNFM